MKTNGNRVQIVTIVDSLFKFAILYNETLKPLIVLIDEANIVYFSAEKIEFTVPHYYKNKESDELFTSTYCRIYVAKIVNGLFNGAHAKKKLIIN